MKKIAKIVGGLIVVIFLAMVGLSAFFFIAGRDIDPPDVSDVLPPPTPPITEAENMVPILMAATNQLVLAQDDGYFLNCCYRRDGWNRRLRTDGNGGRRVLTAEEATVWADRILATNAALFAALDEAVKRPRAQYPAELAEQCVTAWHGDGDSALLGRLWRFEVVDAYLYGNLVALRARRLRELGRAEEAAEELIRYGEMFVRLSFRMENASFIMCVRSPVLPVSDELFQLAVACELSDETIAEIDQTLVRWSSDYLNALRRQNRYCIVRAQNVMPMWKWDIRLSGLQNCFSSHSESMSDETPKWIAALARGISVFLRSFPGYCRYLFQPNRTVGELADIIRSIDAHAYSLPYTVETREFFRAFEDSHPRRMRWTKRNGYGMSEVNGYADWHKFGRMVGFSVFVRDASRVSIAAARYRRKFGNYPSKLEELVPEFLDEVPRDPFDASRSLGYDAEQGTLHTVGPGGTFTGKVRNPRMPYGGLTSPGYRYIRRIDGRSMEIPLQTNTGKEVKVRK